MRVLVSGGNGMLGCTLVPALVALGHEVKILGRSSASEVRANVEDAAETRRALDAANPQVIINLAAATNVDDCERDPGQAFVSNAQIVRNVAGWVAQRRRDAHLIQVSTDQVYDGLGPHLESRVRPINYYAYSKLAGELFAGEVGATIVRTNLFGRSRCPGRTSLSDWLVDRLRSGTRTEVFDDVLFSPLSMETLASLLGRLVELRSEGTFNVGSRAGMSKADFAFLLARRLHLPDAPLFRGSSANLALAARRPADMRMDCTRVEARLGLEMPTLESEINLMEMSYESRG